MKFGHYVWSWLAVCVEVPDAQIKPSNCLSLLVFSTSAHIDLSPHPVHQHFWGANAHVSPLIFKLFLQLLAKFVHHATSNKPHVQPNSLTVTVPPTEFQSFHPTHTCHISPFMVTLLVVPNGSSIGHGAPAWIQSPDLEAVGPHGHLRRAPQGHQPCRQRHELMHLADGNSAVRGIFSEHQQVSDFLG